MRPRLDIPRTRAELVLEALAAAVLAAWAAFVVTSRDTAPARVPVHFGIGGFPDAWGQRSELSVLPVVGLLLYLSLSLLQRYPHIYNYPTRVTPENARTLYQLGRRMLLEVKVLLMAALACIHYSADRIARGEATSLPLGLLPALLVLLALSTATTVTKMVRVRPSREPD